MHVLRYRWWDLLLWWWSTVAEEVACYITLVQTCMLVLWRFGDPLTWLYYIEGDLSTIDYKHKLTQCVGQTVKLNSLHELYSTYQSIQGRKSLCGRSLYCHGDHASNSVHGSIPIPVHGMGSGLWRWPCHSEAYPVCGDAWMESNHLYMYDNFTLIEISTKLFCWSFFRKCSY